MTKFSEVTKAEIENALHNAKEEYKRVEHQIYVSLKYTRTVDVLMNIISRMIDGYDFIMEALLKYAAEKKLIQMIPDSPRERGKLIQKAFPEDQKTVDNIELYFLLRKIFRSVPQKEQEYRRHVTLRTIVDGREELVNIDIITNYFHYILEFLTYVEEMMQNV
ncbi:MAG: hypothetical protein ABIE94_03040 [archaeon]